MLDYEWILMVFGLVTIVTLSKIMAPIRELGAKIHPLIGDLLGCPLCFGFWAGIIMNQLGFSHTYSVVGDALLASGSSFILHCITWRLTTLKDHPF